MSRVITFSRYFPAHHPRKGEATFFVEKILTSIGALPNHVTDFTPGLEVHILNMIQDEFDPKHHTIRAGNRWKAGDWFSPRVWSGKPRESKQIIIAPDIQVKKVWDFSITTEDDDRENDWSYVDFLGKRYTCYGYGRYDDPPMLLEIAKNDGLSLRDFYDWFLTGRNKKQKLNNEPKIFQGQIICWSDKVNY